MRHSYTECNLCHDTDDDKELEMFTYDITRKDKYIICRKDSDEPDDTIHICINCINRIKGFDEASIITEFILS